MCPTQDPRSRTNPSRDGGMEGGGCGDMVRMVDVNTLPDESVRSFAQRLLHCNVLSSGHSFPLYVSDTFFPLPWLTFSRLAVFPLICDLHSADHDDVQWEVVPWSRKSCSHLSPHLLLTSLLWLPSSHISEAPTPSSPIATIGTSKGLFLSSFSVLLLMRGLRTEPSFHLLPTHPIGWSWGLPYFLNCGKIYINWSYSCILQMRCWKLRKKRFL